MDAITIYDFVTEDKSISPIPIEEGSYIRVKRFKDGWFIFKAKELVDQDNIKSIKDLSSIIELRIDNQDGSTSKLKFRKIRGYIHERFIKILEENDQYNPISDREFKDFEEFYVISVKRIARGESIDQQVFIDKLSEFDNQDYDEHTKNFLSYDFPLPDLLFEKDKSSRYSKYLLLLLIKIYSILKDESSFNFGYAVYAVSENLPFKLNDNNLNSIKSMQIISDSNNQFTFLWFIILENFNQAEDLIPKMFTQFSLQFYSKFHDKLFDNITSSSINYKHYINIFLSYFAYFDKANDNSLIYENTLDIEDYNNIINNLSEVIIVYNNKHNNNSSSSSNSSNSSINNNNSISPLEYEKEIKKLISINLNEKNLSILFKCFLLSIPRLNEFKETKILLLNQLLNENQQMFLNVIQHYQKNQQLDIVQSVISKIIKDNKETKLFDIQFSNFTELYSRDISQLFTVESFQSLLEYLYKYNILNNNSHREVLERLGRGYLERLDTSITTEEFIEILKISLVDQYRNFFDALKFKLKFKYTQLKQHSEKVEEFIKTITHIKIYQLSDPSIYPTFNKLLSRVEIFINSKDTILHKEIERRTMVVNKMNYILQVFNHMYQNKQSAYTNLVFRELSNVFNELKELQQFHQNIISNKQDRLLIVNGIHEFDNWEDKIKNSINKAINSILREQVDIEENETNKFEFDQSEANTFFISSLSKSLNQGDNSIEDDHHKYSIFISYISTSINIPYPSDLVNVLLDNSSLEMLESYKNNINNNNNNNSDNNSIQFPNSISTFFKSIESLFIYLHQSFIWYYQRRSKGPISYLLKHNVSTIKNIYNQLCRIVAYFDYSQSQEKSFQECLSVFSYFKPLFIKSNDIHHQLYLDISKEIGSNHYFTIENSLGILEKNKIFNYFINKIEMYNDGSNKYGDFINYLKEIYNKYSIKEQDQFNYLQHQLNNNNNNNSSSNASSNTNSSNELENDKAIINKFEEENEKKVYQLDKERKDFINIYIGEVMTLIMDMFISDSRFGKVLKDVNELWRILNNGSEKVNQFIFDASVKELDDIRTFKILEENTNISSITTQTQAGKDEKLGHLKNAPNPSTIYEIRQSKKLVNQVLGKDYTIEPITDYEEGKHMLLLALAFNKSSYKIWYYLGRYLRHDDIETLPEGEFTKLDFYKRAKEKLPNENGVNKKILEDIEREMEECKRYNITEWDIQKVGDWLNKHSILKDYINDLKGVDGKELLNIYKNRNYKYYNLNTIGSQKNFIYQMNIELGVKRLNKIKTKQLLDDTILNQNIDQISELIVQKKFSVPIAYGFLQQQINGIALLSLEEDDYKYLGISNDQQKQSLTNLINSYYR